MESESISLRGTTTLPDRYLSIHLSSGSGVCSASQSCLMSERRISFRFLCQVKLARLSRLLLFFIWLLKQTPADNRAAATKAHRRDVIMLVSRLIPTAVLKQRWPHNVFCSLLMKFWEVSHLQEDSNQHSLHCCIPPTPPAPCRPWSLKYGPPPNSKRQHLSPSRPWP